MYDFRTLSPIDFELLVRDLLQAELKITMESFGPGKDGGIDFRFAMADQNLVIQAKHHVEGGARSLLRALMKEDRKVLQLNPSRYILGTSASLTPELKRKIIKAMPSTPISAGDVFGREDLNNLLGLHPHVLRQHFKLWLTSAEVLERILHSAVYNRTDAELARIKQLVPKFLHNASVSEAEKILEDRGALIIAGEPGVGKTTLGRMLLWLHMEQNWKVFDESLTLNIQNRRDALEERESEEDTDPYQQAGSQEPVGEISDAEIKSMFSLMANGPVSGYLR